MIVPVPARNLCKLSVHPEELCIVIHKRIGDLKFIQKLLLNGTVLRRKIDQFLRQRRPASPVSHQRHKKVNYHKPGKDNSRHDLIQIQKKIHYNQQNVQHQRPAEICTELSF